MRADTYRMKLNTISGSNYRTDTKQASYQRFSITKIGQD